MRARNVKPGFFKNEKLAEMPFEARLLFIGLWGMADREGRLEDRPKRIKAEIFPYDNINVVKLLNVITLHGFIFRYAANENQYIQIINFTKHQNPHPHESKSTIPPMSLQDAECNLPAVLNPDVRNPSNLNPDIPPAGAFELIWEKYPKKKGKKAAERHFDASVKTTRDWLDIQNALDNYIAEIKRENIEDAYIKHGSTWFFNWRDDINYRGVVLPATPRPAPKPIEPPPPPPTEEELDVQHYQLVDTVGRGKCKEPNCPRCARRIHVPS